MTFFTGECSIHDLSITRQGLLGVNTRFSNVSLIDGQYSFNPVWQPSFISALTPDDRCHLNGFATDDQRVLYATAFGCFDEPQGWRAHEPTSGIVIDAAANQVLCGGLCLPHSPRLVDHRLFLLESGQGRVLTIDRQSGRKDCRRTTGLCAWPRRPGWYPVRRLVRCASNRTRLLAADRSKPVIMDGRRRPRRRHGSSARHDALA